ncbi:hypothetical protein GCM10009645_42740 [Mycolicibacterium poriferae]|uniref:Alginate lyase 2 domain-containing protein n=1 Tax=Mycolicibacterium poriferae TaxID=39694 RepID=A0A6N4V8J1_9MYCO|nr:heparin lyase I family protein [Mycolicibacterium poriferae]MCV7263599.1 heparin lyase I family protein [Mycolicibacterium poriferae]BBX50944.1 hypothetical protein MPOR_19700 [Mycolicibacterium poriferae]
MAVGLIANPIELSEGDLGYPLSGYNLNAVDYVTVDSRRMRVQAVEEKHAFSIAAKDTYRFETRKNDFGWSGDKKSNNRRSELIANDARYYSGEVLWSSFSFVVGPKHVPFDNGKSSHNQITQWHSVDGDDEGRAPVFDIQLNGGDLLVVTRSDAKGPATWDVHYRQPRPSDGAQHSVVVAGLLGRRGHLDVWLDGNQIVNVDTPIGYYEDDGGQRALAYPHWGLYQDNVDHPAIIYHSNIEWGLANLSDRINHPKNVNKPSGGWS